MPDFPCAAIVLAAGASARLGQPKQLIAIEGETLLHRTARLAIEAQCSPVYVVLGFEADKMSPELAGLTVETVLHPDWQQGMGSSLRAGMQALLRTQPHPHAVLLLVCDQPRLSLQHIRALLKQHTMDAPDGKVAITASYYAQRNGVPAVFSACLFSDLLAISGDRGARDLIGARAAQVRGIPWPIGELDLDRPEDITRI